MSEPTNTTPESSGTSSTQKPLEEWTTLDLLRHSISRLEKKDSNSAYLKDLRNQLAGYESPTYKAIEEIRYSGGTRNLQPKSEYPTDYDLAELAQKEMAQRRDTKTK